MATISDLFIASYDAALHAVPQHGSKLKNTVRIKSGIMGDRHRFPVLGKAIARSRPAFQPIQSGSTVKRKPEALLRNAEHFVFLDEYEVSETNVAAAPGYARNSRLAVERACDQRIIAAWDATLPSTTQAYGTLQARTANVALSRGEMAKALTVLLRNGVGTGDMLTFAYSQRQFEAIAGIDELLSRDYSERGFVATGTPPPIYGMQWRGIETREEGGIADNNGYLYAKNSTGLAEGTVMRMRVTDWRPDIGAWQIGAKLFVGATRIDNTMISRRGLSNPT